MKIKVFCLSFLFITVTGIGAFAAGDSGFGSGAAVIAGRTELVKGGISGETVRFCDSDFKAALGIADFSVLTVTSLPSESEGILVYAGRRAAVGERIKRRNIPVLAFLPASDEVDEATFTFKIDGSENDVRCVIRFTARSNSAPRLEGETLTAATAWSGVGFGGEITATDPDGDEIEYIVTSYPENGWLEISDAGRYFYTPKKGFVGEDSFSYTVRDEFGNFSDIGRVTVKVLRPECDTVFSDMVGRSEHAAALFLDSRGILAGKTDGGASVFMPDETVSRAELVTALMKAIGCSGSEGSTFFDDDDDIPDECRPFVKDAAAMGLVFGKLGDSGLCFSPSETVTRHEAARLATSALGLKDTGDECTVYAEYEGVPSHSKWAVDAAYSLGLLTTRGDTAKGALSRAEAAVMLTRIVSLASR